MPSRSTPWLHASIRYLPDQRDFGHGLLDDRLFESRFECIEFVPETCQLFSHFRYTSQVGLLALNVFEGARRCPPEHLARWDPLPRWYATLGSHYAIVVDTAVVGDPDLPTDHRFAPDGRAARNASL